MAAAHTGPTSASAARAGPPSVPAAADAAADLERACMERQPVAKRLGAERRRLFFAGALISLAAPLLPYLAGAWESAWFTLAALGWPFAARAVVFLLGFYVVMAVVMLPLAYYGGFVVAHAFGLSRQTRGAWAVDWLKATLLGTLLATVAGGVFLWTVIAMGSSWWWVFGVFASAVGLLLVFVTPYVLVPLFFKMRPLEDTATVERIHALVNRAGTPVRDVCSLDFSRRTAEANAAVIGLGRSRRVVLADTLLAEFTPAEIDAVVAHELGHHVHRDVQRLLVVNGVIMWLGLFVAGQFSDLALPILSLPSLAYVPGFPVLVFVTELYFLLLAPLLNAWSRHLESEADRFALRLTREPGAFASAMRRIGCQNLAELRPPRWSELLLATHPALYRRIELALSFTPSPSAPPFAPSVSRAPPLAPSLTASKRNREPSRGPSHEDEKASSQYHNGAPGRHADITKSPMDD